jgi:hypothetical protein
VELSQIFEAIMLISFGVAWPISIYKLCKTKDTGGKSRLFLAVVILGYISGILHKFYSHLDFVTIFYTINLIMVIIDFCLCCKYKKVKS